MLTFGAGEEAQLSALCLSQAGVLAASVQVVTAVVLGTGAGGTGTPGCGLWGEDSATERLAEKTHPASLISLHPLLTSSALGLLWARQYSSQRCSGV